MKLRAVELTDIRRFAGQTVRVGEIGDGVSVLAAPNESGKSTLFDALHALMFQPHRGRPKEVISLRPHADGAPTVEAEVEIDNRRYRIRKRWLSRPEARVMGPDGSLIAQADQAEAWIADHLAGPLGGPSGLLWIRQGRAEFDRKDDPTARRDVLSQVAGEIDAMTGGRRMDAVQARVAAALEPMVTPNTGKPRGPLLEAQREVDRLATEEADLAAQVATLAQALADRQRAQRRRAELDDPQAAAERAARLASARAQAEALRLHGTRREKAAMALRMAEAAQVNAAAARDRLRALADHVAAAELALRQAEAERTAGTTRADATRQTASRARAQADAAAQALAALRQRQGAALRRQQARAAAQQLADLTDRLAQIDAALTRAAEAEAARATITATPERVERARQAEAQLAELTARAEARAVTLRFAYDGAQRALRDGQPVEGVQRLTGPARFDLPGLGRLEVEPGTTDAAAARLPEARAALARALDACGAASVAAAVAALAQADDLAQQARSARQIAAALAPEGVEALRQARARAQALAGTADEGNDDGPETLLAALAQAEPDGTAAEAEARAAEAADARAAQDLAAAAATAAAARQRLEQATAQRGTEDDHAAALAQAEAQVQAAAAALDQARADAAALDRAAPDADSVAARLAQAEGAVRQHAEERDALVVRLAGLQGQIGALAEQGIEERLSETRDRLTVARALAQARQAEVAALQRLRAALDAARASARNVYLAPVLQELAPMLALLHPGAEVALDDASLLPAGLERGGRSEAIEILSGGTREQIAVLTRLAFARLFARTGRALPVILDDALVQTDDDRIEAMFTALHRAAQGQQVIVLTCRQRAFAALGGQRLEFRRIDG